MAGKKGKPKKAPEPNEASKLIAARITQLEQDAAGEKDQEAEIGACLSLLLAGCLEDNDGCVGIDKGGRKAQKHSTVVDRTSSVNLCCMSSDHPPVSIGT